MLLPEFGVVDDPLDPDPEGEPVEEPVDEPDPRLVDGLVELFVGSHGGAICPGVLELELDEPLRALVPSCVVLDPFRFEPERFPLWPLEDDPDADEPEPVDEPEPLALEPVLLPLCVLPLVSVEEGVQGVELVLDGFCPCCDPLVVELWAAKPVIVIAAANANALIVVMYRFIRVSFEKW